MVARFLCFFALLALVVGSSYADEVIWKGDVTSDGVATDPITLTLRETYQIKVSQYINLGKWNQATYQLANDACYEFSKKGATTKLECLRNSQNISVCDGTFHSNHFYQSEPFVAKQNRIFFWVYDTDYDDNSGAFHVEIIHKSK